MMERDLIIWAAGFLLAVREQFYLHARTLNARNRANHKLPKYVGPLATKPEETTLVQ